jgi:hypothetical protein
MDQCAKENSMGRAARYPSKSAEPVVANAYAVVDNNEVIVPTARVVEFDRPDFHTTSSAYAHIPESIGLVWNDDFFDDSDDHVVAVFDMDYERLISYYRSVSWLAYIGSIFVPNCWWLGLCLGVPCYLNENVNWSVRSQHVAITQNGICYVQAKRKTLWGSSCTDVPKYTITVRLFGKISDILRT